MPESRNLNSTKLFLNCISLNYFLTIVYWHTCNKAQIAGACGCSRTTVIKVLNIAAAQGLSYPLPDGMSDKQLADILFPANAAKPEYKMPDYEYVAHEMQKSGVTLNLLWLAFVNKKLSHSANKKVSQF